MEKITVQLEVDGPISEMDVADLEKREGLVDNENERTTWVEYWIKGTIDRPVHRSVHVTLKKSPAFMVGGIGEVGG